jgi:hypothetical protein
MDHHVVIRLAEQSQSQPGELALGNELECQPGRRVGVELCTRTCDLASGDDIVAVSPAWRRTSCMNGLGWP